MDVWLSLGGPISILGKSETTTFIWYKMFDKKTYIILWFFFLLWFLKYMLYYSELIEYLLTSWIVEFLIEITNR